MKTIGKKQVQTKRANSGSGNGSSGGHARPLPLTLDLTQPGRLRVGHLMTLYTCGHSAIYARIKAGSLPAPDGRDPRPYWKTATIFADLSR